MAIYLDSGEITATLAAIKQTVATIAANQIVVSGYLQNIIQQETKEMAALDDLNKAVADIQAAATAIQAADTSVAAAVQTAIDLIQTLHTGAAGSVTDQQVEDAVSQLETVAGNVSTAASDLSNAANNLGGVKPQP